MRLVRMTIDGRPHFAIERGLFWLKKYLDLIDYTCWWTTDSCYFHCCVVEDTPENRRKLARRFPQFFIDEIEVLANAA